MSLVPSSLRHDFVYFFGRLATIKQVLLNQSQINRILGADSTKDFLHVLLELPFTNYIDQGLSSPEEIFLALSEWIAREIKNGIPEDQQKILYLPWLEHFSAAVSIALKKKHNFAVNSLYAEPTDTVHHVMDVLRGEANANVPTEVVHIITDLQTQPFTSPQEIDRAVAAAFAILSIKAAKASHNKNIIRYTQAKIDCLNLKNALRQNQTASDFVPGGLLPITMFSQPRANWATTIASVGYNSLRDFGNETLTTEERELLCTNCINATIAAMWGTPISIDIAFAFVVTALNHIAIVRTVFIGKKNDLTPVEIDRILPPFIPASIYSV